MMKYPWQTEFIEKRGLFGSQFWRFKSMALDRFSCGENLPVYITSWQEYT
jgi:hypothetical protein